MRIKSTVVLVFVSLTASSQTNTFPTSGNVGIGTITPSEKLEVNGNIQIGYNQFIKGRRQGGIASNLIGYIPTELDNHILALSEYSSVPSEVRLYTPTDPNQGISIYSDKRLVFFRNDGNVGIGTSTPRSKLAVNGQIRATEVKVIASIDVPDYVFEPNYELKTLKEIKKYISKNKHLPEIPSAANIDENGIDLGEMNMRLLKKIEELTLYQIELLERIEQVENKIDQMDGGSVGHE